MEKEGPSPSQAATSNAHTAVKAESCIYLSLLLVRDRAGFALLIVNHRTLLTFCLTSRLANPRASYSTQWLFLLAIPHWQMVFCSLISAVNDSGLDWTIADSGTPVPTPVPAAVTDADSTSPLAPGCFTAIPLLAWWRHKGSRPVLSGETRLCGSSEKANRRTSSSRTSQVQTLAETSAS